MRARARCWLQQARRHWQLHQHHQQQQQQQRGLAALKVLGKEYARDSMTNVTPAIIERIDANLLAQEAHPLSILLSHIEGYFQQERFHQDGGDSPFQFKRSLNPIVTPEQNFDSLLIPENHPSRSPSDNYYLNKDYMLRAHTSAHQAELISSGLSAFLCSGDVYRRDEIDRSHYPVFHQTEGVRLFSIDEVNRMGGSSVFARSRARTPLHQETHTEAAARVVGEHLRNTLSGLVEHLFGPVQQRWVSCYFPFTHPSWELEIWFEGEWLEVLGCGVIEQDILEACGAEHRVGWAFGLGLERLAMVLFEIPDIRLFWSRDERFLSQFSAGASIHTTKFKSFSKYPPCNKDVSFWIGEDFSANSFADVVRSVAGDLVEEVKLVDSFTHPKTGRHSRTFRIVYRSMDRTVTNDEINAVQEQLRDTVAHELGVELR